MQITIFGAGGATGQLTVALALRRGYTVKASVHSHNPFEPQPGLTVLSGDIYDAAHVRTALQGSQVVISTLGSWHTKQKNILETAMGHIIPAMRAFSITRIISLTGSGAVWQGDSPSFVDRLNRRALLLVAPKILRDGEAHIALLAASELDWTVVRSPVMTAKPNIKYALKNKLAPLYATIPRNAVAASLVDQVEADDYLGRAPVIFKHL